MKMILTAMKEAGWGADNLAFGSGGALLQKLNRDTQKCAFKCSYAMIDGEGVNVQKDPITDPGKKSTAGRLTLERADDGTWKTVTEGKGDASLDQLVDVFKDGELLVDYTFAQIRQRADGAVVAPIPASPPITDRTVTDFNNIVMLTDSYKVTHHLQYPPGTTRVYSYFESRGGLFQEVCFFGLQYFMKKYMVGEVVTQAKIDAADEYFKIHFSNPVWGYNDKLFNRAGWEHIVKNLGGKLPVEIKAVPEGTCLPYKNALFTMENTDDQCFWLTNYLESLLVQVWYTTTVCTQSREHKKIVMRFLRDTGSQDVIDKGLHMFKLHDFGFRGVSSVESAAMGGAGHLVNWLGTDSMVCLMLLKEYYSEAISGFSIPASEHSTMTSWGREKEVDAMRNMLTQYPKGIMACVSDSYDIYKACTDYWGGELKAQVEARDGILVVRPDSGELPKIVLDVLEKLESKFGHKMTSTGHKLLPDCIRVIQGDGVDIGSMEMILTAMKEAGWGADNLLFGSGGGLLQKLHRDTQKCAFKCSYALIEGKDTDVEKDPITDPGKKSKKGRLSLERDAEGKWTTVTEGKGDASKDQLKLVFRNGELISDQKFADIRARANV